MHGNFTPFMSKSFQIWDHLFHLIFPNNSENLKSLDIGRQAVGAKRRLNKVNKWRRRKKRKKKNFFCCSDFTPLMGNSFQIWDHFFPLLSPMDSKSIKSCTLDFGKWWLKTVKRSDKHQYQKNPAQ